MNYKHIYHAGGFVDVFKHCVLIALLQSFFHKDKPIMYLDTHAGRGKYDLFRHEAQQTKEYEEGISRIYGQAPAPSIIENYMAIIRAMNKNQPKSDRLHFYPGSPYIAEALLRASDRIVLAEVQAKEYTALCDLFQHDRRVHVYHQDGYQLLQAMIPPLERRGLVMLDPAYENMTEINEIRTHLKKALRKWSTGVYALWYPIKGERENQLLHANFRRDFADWPVLALELTIYPLDVANELNGTGMLIINPPWQLDIKAAEFLPWLWQRLRQSPNSRYSITWLSRRE